MNFLEERIIKEGVVKPGNILKVDSFLNHQMDIGLIEQVGEAFYRRFRQLSITKVLTLESSGIAVAYPVTRAFGVPMVCAKKAKSINIDGDVYIARVQASSGKGERQVVVSKKFLTAEDKVLIIDDLLANGGTLQGLISIVESADAQVMGLGVVIEKGFMDGGYRLRNLGYHLESLAVIQSMDAATGKIEFQQE